MRRPRLLRLLGLVALLVLWGWLLLRPKPKPLGGPTKANFDRIQPGMMVDEVVAILGPDGVHAERPVIRKIAGHVDSRHRHGRPRLEWVEDDCIITIEYSDSDRPRVVATRYAKWSPESFRERLRRWLLWCERAFGSS